uniref:Agenet domain-containing protein n=1 Tax=Brassica oleracea var. oleracea TaxID=109376 RepID=A0A0D3DYR6_BRAOL
MDEGFVKGDKVEVCSKQDGFFGSYFEAKVLSKLPRGSFYKVKYKNLVTEGEDPMPLIEIISADEIRSMPPKLFQPSTFRRHDKVDAFDLDAWWFGEIIGQKGDMFSVPRPMMCASTHLNVSEGILIWLMDTGFLQQQGNDFLDSDMFLVINCCL